MLPWLCGIRHTSAAWLLSKYSPQAAERRDEKTPRAHSHSPEIEPDCRAAHHALQMPREVALELQHFLAGREERTPSGGRSAQRMLWRRNHNVSD